MKKVVDFILTWTFGLVAFTICFFTKMFIDVVKNFYKKVSK